MRSVNLPPKPLFPGNLPEIGFFSQKLSGFVLCRDIKELIPKRSMRKIWYKSKTIWGGILLAVEAVLQSLNADFHTPLLRAALFGLGTFLTIFGFRAAMK